MHAKNLGMGAALGPKPPKLSVCCPCDASSPSHTSESAAALGQVLSQAATHSFVTSILSALTNLPVYRHSHACLLCEDQSVNLSAASGLITVGHSPQLRMRTHARAPADKHTRASG